MLKNTVGLSFGMAGALLGAAMFFLPACGGTGDATGCTPNETKTCACPGGREGVQTCSSDGSALSVCNCSDGNGGNGGSGAGTSNGGNGGSGGEGGGTTMSGLCGNGVPDAGECDGGEFPCPQDCTGTTTSTGMTTTSTTDPCEGHIYFSGLAMGATSAWGSHPNAGGATGYEAGINICQTTGGTHPCDYEEVLAAEAAGELANIPQGTTAWIHRTTVAMVGGNPSDPGPGGRCNDWTYTTNHISDGEFVSFDQTGIPTYHLDNDTFFDGVDTSHAQVGQLQCNGEVRAILCCYPACE